MPAAALNILCRKLRYRSDTAQSYLLECVCSNLIRMHRVVFYSWQSDLPNATNRSFIQQALENAAKTIKMDEAVDIEPVIDRDTEGVAGAPDIAKTIFQKIASADVVIADISIISGQREGRPTPNPNVLIELGYALHAVGDERVVLVFNTACGKFEQLPFDLKMRRVVSYDMPESVTDRSTERKKLASKLDFALRSALASIRLEPPRSLIAEAHEAIESGAPNRVIVLRRFLGDLLKQLLERRPQSVEEGATAQDFEDAVMQTENIARDYARLSEAVATLNDEASAHILYRGFGPVLEQYEVARQPGGSFYSADFDFMNFHGHELFTMLIACLIREDRWEIIATLLDEGIPVKYLRRENGPGNCYFADLSEHLDFGRQLSQERSRMSVHADLLRTRHAPEGDLGQIVSLDDFLAADYFLFLRGELSPEAAPSSFLSWRPWSTAFLKAVPRFIRDSENATVARRIAKAMGVPDVASFQQRLVERRGRIKLLWRSGFWDQPLSQADVERIATRGSLAD
jgi:hypothetical protein